MAAIAGVGKIRDGALIRYYGIGDETEGVVVDQSDPVGYFDDGNVCLLDLTVQPVGGEETREVSGGQVREVVAEPGEHEHGPEDGASGGGVPREIEPGGPEDVREFVDCHGADGHAFQYRSDGGETSATASVERVGGALVTVVTEDGDQLGIPYATLDRIAVAD